MARRGPERLSCPICGALNRTEFTFTCSQCGRQGLCKRHQVYAGWVIPSYRCEECSPAATFKLVVKVIGCLFWAFVILCVLAVWFSMGRNK